MLDSLTASPSFLELAEPEARMIGAIRLSVALNGAGQCPIHAVAEKLGSLRTAAHLHLLLDEIAAA